MLLLDLKRKSSFLILISLHPYHGKREVLVKSPVSLSLKGVFAKN